MEWKETYTRCNTTRNLEEKKKKKKKKKEEEEIRQKAKTQRFVIPS